MLPEGSHLAMDAPETRRERTKLPTELLSDLVGVALGTTPPMAAIVQTYYIDA